MWYVLIGLVILVAGVLAYKKNQKKVMLQMEILSSIANLVALFRITEKVSPSGSYSDVEDSEKQKLAAICNYLFCHKPQPSHLEKYSSTEIANSAMHFLDNDKKLCELVVQSVRVNHVVYYFKTKARLELGYELLEKYGARCPNSPEPEAFLYLVRSLISELNEANRTSVLRHAASNWPNFYRQRLAA